MTHSAPNAGEAVQDFYREMPFNYYADPAQAAANLAANPIAAYPDLDALLEEDEVGSVLELGCGAGWAASRPRCSPSACARSRRSIKTLRPAPCFSAASFTALES